MATDGRDRILGLAFVYYFSDLDYGYLQYFASDPRKPARGIGVALYEALRELLSARGARGLFLDVPPVEPDKVKDRSRLPTNRKRLRFYARYDAQKVVGTLWDVEANPRNDGYLTTLLYDPLGRRPSLNQRDARRVVRRILVDQYAFEPDDPFVARIVRSFGDPVKLEALSPQPERAAPTRAKYLLPIKMVVSERHTIHHLREKGYVERPVRVTAILKGLEGLPIERVPTRHFAEDHLTAVHTPALVGYLKAMGQRLDAKAIIYPEVFPIRRPDRIPRALEDRAGYFCADTFTPLTQNVFTAARDAANVALTAATLIANGERFVYALCRPPGHHAERRIYGGFCFFNNSAIAANYLSRQGKVALLDIDYHHGNGGQDIFYDRSDVLTVSIHGHPSHAYPNFSGYSDERGEGVGLGFNHNFPTEPPVDDERYLTPARQGARRRARLRSALSRLVDRLRHHARRPDGIVRRHQPGHAAHRPAHRPFWPPDAHRAGRRLLARQPARRGARLLPRHHRSLARLSRSVRRRDLRGEGRRRLAACTVQIGHRHVGADPRADGGEHHVHPVVGVADHRERGERVPEAAPVRRRDALAGDDR